MSSRLAFSPADSPNLRLKYSAVLPASAGERLATVGAATTPEKAPDRCFVGISGMMTGQQMSALTAASGAAFDMMFLQLMITHHQGGTHDGHH